MEALSLEIDPNELLISLSVSATVRRISSLSVQPKPDIMATNKTNAQRGSMNSTNNSASNKPNSHKGSGNQYVLHISKNWSDTDTNTGSESDSGSGVNGLKYVFGTRPTAMAVGE
ncbi:unnamed protein product [Ceratitis capitata]|uniref:(Mediterranean fruit fly) hypothetical protein n=1 Tax=Ceratitis capitata TaxID=7213 RepID=A0A811UYM3_CERCA|nr:unnamed protein product [Ceratitis capitata]